MNVKNPCHFCQRKPIAPNRSKYCSADCARLSHNEQIKSIVRRLRSGLQANTKFIGCEVCKFKGITTLHKEGDREYVLCPNHKTMVTKGLVTIEELLNAKRMEHGTGSDSGPKSAV